MYGAFMMSSLFFLHMFGCFSSIDQEKNIYITGHAIPLYSVQYRLLYQVVSKPMLLGKRINVWQYGSNKTSQNEPQCHKK